MTTVTEYFGSGATLSGTTLTVNLAPLATKFGMNTTTPKASQALALLIMQAESATDTKVSDPLYGVTIEAGFNSIVARGESSQIANGYTVNIYTPNPNATLDPDNVI